MACKDSLVVPTEFAEPSHVSDFEKYAAVLGIDTSFVFATMICILVDLTHSGAIPAWKPRMAPGDVHGRIGQLNVCKMCTVTVQEPNFNFLHYIMITVLSIIGVARNHM